MSHLADTAKTWPLTASHSSYCGECQLWPDKHVTFHSTHQSCPVYQLHTHIHVLTPALTHITHSMRCQSVLLWRMYLIKLPTAAAIQNVHGLFLYTQPCINTYTLYSFLCFIINSPINNTIQFPILCLPVAMQLFLQYYLISISLCMHARTQELQEYFIPPKVSTAGIGCDKGQYLGQSSPVQICVVPCLALCVLWI